MSEKQEHRKRFNARLEYVRAFEMWLKAEPLFRFIAWHRWKKQRPAHPFPRM